MSRLICRLSSLGTEVQGVAADSSARLSDRDNDLDLDRYSTRQRAHTYRRAGVPAGLAEYLDKEVGAAIDDLRVILEIGCGIDHSEHLDDVLTAAEIAAERILDRRDQDEPDAARVTVPFVDRHAGGELAFRHCAAGVVGRALPRKIEQVAAALGMDI